MQTIFRLFCLPVFLLFSTPVFSSETIDMLPCALPEPAGFSLMEKGTNWAKLRWLPVNNAIAYRIRAYKSPNSMLAVDTTVDAQITVIVLRELTSGATYRFTVAGVCSNGLASNHIATIKETIIVLDLILKASGILTQTSPLQSGGACMETGWDAPSGYNGILIDVAKGADHAFLKLETVSATQVDVTHLLLDSSLPVYVEENDITGNLQIFDISDPEEPLICLLTVARVQTAQPKIRLCTENMPSNYSVNYSWGLWLPEEGLIGSPDDRRNTTGPGREAAWDCRLLENPFEGSIAIQFDGRPGTAQLRLYDAGGRLRHMETLQPAGNTWRLPAGDLPPGCYFLSVQTANERKMMKLVKQ